ncbi:MAG: flagellar biosynthesis protein FlhA [Nitrospinota bacterium]
MAVEARAVPEIARYSDIALATGLIGIIVLMVIPLPTFLLDVMLSLSITIAMIIMMIAIYMKSALEFSAFPSVLLIVTLFRLSVNIATTRLILLHGSEGTGAAGAVIESFGGFVVGGNYVVGAVIFTILVMINFIVITKGSVRTSEVAARFTLDAIPGKQMAIDADLNAGLITEDQARTRRRNLEREADFYGSMDGAIRFVRGDAIASIIITLINVLGGFAIGVLQQGMELQEALGIYTLLTIGDGLVSQIPALVVSTAAGLVVTRAASESDMGTAIASQLLVHPRAFVIASAALAFFGLIPGLPHIAFFFLAAVSGLIGYLSFHAEQEFETKLRTDAEKEASASVPEKVEALLPLDRMELEIGYELIPLVDASQDGELLDRIKSIRRQFALEMGFIVPPLHIRDNLQLKPNEYSVMLKGVKIAGGELWMNHYLAMDPGTGVEPIPGTKTTEPTFGLPALWISEANKERAKSAGYTVVDVPTVLTTHIKEVIKNHAHELLGRQEVSTLLDTFKEHSPKVVEELVPNVLTLGQVQNVMQNLLKEQVSVRDLGTILETLADWGAVTKDSDILTEYARQALAMQITDQYLTEDRKLPLLTLGQEAENAVAEAIKQTQHGSYLALDPDKAQKLIDSVKKEMEKFGMLNYQPILLTNPTIRLHIRRLTERFIPNLIVLSHNEVLPGTNLEAIGVANI